MLLKSDDKMSRYIGLQMLEKVNLEYLLSMGYIQLIGVPIQEPSYDMCQFQNFDDLMQLQEIEQSQESDITDDQSAAFKSYQEMAEDNMVSALAPVYEGIDPIIKFMSGNID
ncbi:hypothetical protein [Psychrobacter sp. I-STPA10]|uniref:hypothetical protein n=1 Tax=Psychrobacter sp. I-STPA10 TaxID=2585769 RepID=UPI001E2F35F0|nr:hypothetical protein [Psychrobacter sp. I-STPA10]